MKRKSFLIYFTCLLSLSVVSININNKQTIVNAALGNYNNIPNGGYDESTISEHKSAYYTNLYSEDMLSSFGVSLQEKLFNLIKGHTARSYGYDYDTAMCYTDRDWTLSPNVSTSNPYMRILYGDKFNGSEQTAMKFSNKVSGSYGWNREHTWAKSRGDFGTSTGAGTDLHHLISADNRVNSARSNYGFGVVTSLKKEAVDSEGNVSGKVGTSEGYGSNYVYEPEDEFKGDVSRALFYMATRYGQFANLGYNLTIVDRATPAQTSKSDATLGILSTLLKWNIDDPVDSYERNRNEIIYSNVQGNRNPYVDHPEFACAIYGSANQAACQSANYTMSNGGFGEAVPVEVNVTFNIEDAMGSAPSSQKANAYSTIALPSSNGISKDGYTFIGWDDGKKIYDASASYVLGNQDVEFKASWISNEQVADAVINKEIADLHDKFDISLSGEVEELPTQLPITGSNDITISWLSDTLNVLVDNTGKVTFIRNDSNQNVTLTATVTYLNTSKSISFTFTLLNDVEVDDENMLLHHENGEDVSLVKDGVETLSISTTSMSGEEVIPNSTDKLEWKTGIASGSPATPMGNKDGLKLYGTSSGSTFMNSTTPTPYAISSLSIEFSSAKGDPYLDIYGSTNGSSWESVAQQLGVEFSQSKIEFPLNKNYTYFRIVNKPKGTAQALIYSVDVTYGMPEHLKENDTLIVDTNTSIKIDGSAIRFSYVMDKDTLNTTFVDTSISYTSLTYGVMIASLSDMEYYGYTSILQLDSAHKEKVSYSSILYKDGENSFRVMGELSNLNSKDYDNKYVAIGYVSDGVNTYYTSQVIASIRQIATIAYQDSNDEALLNIINA